MSTDRSREGFSVRGLLPILVLDIACPYLAYTYLTHRVPGISPALALVLAGVFPALGNVLSLIRSRTLDIIGVFVLFGLAVGAATAFLSGDPKLVLIRESFVTGALGVICLFSLLWRRPLLFFIGRDFSTGHDPVRVAEFNALWQYPGARRVFRIMTMVWGVGWVGEFTLKVLLVLSLPIPRMLVVGPIVSNGVTIALILWTLRYARESRRRGEMLRAAAGAAGPQSPALP